MFWWVYDFYTTWWFKKVCLSVELASKPRRPENVVNNLNVNTVWEILQKNRRITCEESAASANISQTSIFHILPKILQFTHVFSWCIPHHLTKEIMQIKIHQCFSWKQILQNYFKFRKTAITVDETWKLYSNPFIKSVISVLKNIDSPPLKIYVTNKICKKVLDDYFLSS